MRYTIRESRVASRGHPAMDQLDRSGRLQDGKHGLEELRREGWES